MNFQYGVELLGTLTFAISGALALDDEELDLLGASFTAFITAIGGGTLRDLLLDSHPLVWINDGNILWAVFLGLVLTFSFYPYFERLRRTLLLFDSLGIALFTVLGTEKALNLEVAPGIAVIMGMFSAVMGGVLRDTLSNQTPVLFRREIYASPCLLGGTLFVLLDQGGLQRELNMLLSIASIMAVRLLAVRYHWALPRFKMRAS